ncbi:hypothetical protein ACRAWF_24890, partial [Streptomyces sp. L7]
IDSYFGHDGSPLIRVTGEDGRDAGLWFPTGDVADHRRRRLHADHRPQQGRDQVRRRVDRAPSTSRTSRWRIPPIHDGRLSSPSRHPKWDERPPLVVVRKPTDVRRRR